MDSATVCSVLCAPFAGVTTKTSVPVVLVPETTVHIMIGAWKSLETALAVSQEYA
jgi:hypothetical protein